MRATLAMSAASMLSLLPPPRPLRAWSLRREEGGRVVWLSRRTTEQSESSTSFPTNWEAKINVAQPARCVELVLVEGQADWVSAVARPILVALGAFRR